MIKGQQFDPEILAAAVSFADDSVVITDANLDDPRIVYVNPAFTRMTGYEAEEVLGRNPKLLQGPRTDRTVLDQLKSDLKNGRIFRGEGVNYRKDGKEFINEWHIEPIKAEDGHVTHYLAIQRDISERRHAEERLLQAQKMDAVGLLAGGIAHDFNNVMTVILGYTDLTLNELPPQHPMRKRLEAIRHAGEHATLLTKRLLATSRRQKVNPTVLDVNVIVRNLSVILRRVLGQNIELSLNLAPSLQCIKADANQIEQILLNLAVNARDAMASGGKLIFETRDENDAVVLGVIDTGVGMSPDIKARIFEPFFTTKAPGKGTGLGLATVQDIVSKNQGTITVASTPGVGTTFNVRFPAVQQPPKQKTSTGISPLPGGTETILAVDDEHGVRDFVHDVLTSCGYTVLSAKDADDAILMAQRHASTINLVLTDVMLPKLDGFSLVKQLREIVKNIPIIYISGYSSPNLKDFGVQAQTVILQKPITPLALATKVRQTLDGKQNG